MTLFKLSQSIRSLNKEGKFSEALKFFRENKLAFTPEQIGSNKYIVSEIVAALIETGHHNAIFAFIEQYKVVLAPNQFSSLLKKFKNKPTVNWTVINKFCDLATVELLSIECRSIEVERKGIKKQMELASDKENWYAFKTKALFETQHYLECFELSKQALETFDKFHYSNDVWFARRIALSKKHLGNPSDALNELLEILKKKKEWFIQTEVAEIYKEKGDPDNAFKYAIDAINNFGNLEYKVGLLVLIAELLDTKNEKELSFKHFMLSKLLRQHEEWGVPHSLELALQISGFAQLTMEQLPALKNELKKYWDSFKPQQPTQKTKSNELVTGRIDKILHNNERGADGFIKYDNKSIYFKLNTSDDLIRKLKIGLEVKFEIQPTKKEGKKKMASNIKQV